jgi:hypothetical protein
MAYSYIECTHILCPPKLYEDFHYEPKLFSLYPDPKPISDANLLIMLRLKLIRACEEVLRTDGYIKEVLIHGGFVFTYLWRNSFNLDILYGPPRVDAIYLDPKLFNLSPLYTLHPEYRFTKINVRSDYVIVFSY